MSLRNLDIESVLRRLAERRIEEAMEEGKFDNLPGAGKPLDLEPMPAEENARMMWWALKLFRQNDYTPDEVQWRKRVDLLKGELGTTRELKRVRELVTEVNDLVHRINTLGTNALKAPIFTVDLEQELEKCRQRMRQ